jgi:hypothetical protein
MDVKVLWSSRDWAEAVAELPAAGPLPCRTVLVPRERVAHVLRRELIRTQRADVLAGTRFLSARFAALEVLRAAGVPFESGEEALRKARLRALFQTERRLENFSLELLRSRPGWDEAFASTIADLEGARLRPDDLETQGLGRLRDVAAIWRAIDDSAGHSWTIQRTYSEAAAVLGQSAGAWPLQGSRPGWWCRSCG